MLLLLDGHYSHTQNIELINLAKQNIVTIVSLPPHCSHKLQPLDKTFMGFLKVYYSEEIGQWLRHNERALSSFDVMELFDKAYITCQTAQIAINGFEVTEPFNKNQFSDAEYIEEASKEQEPFYECVFKKHTAGNYLSLPENREECNEDEPQVTELECDPNQPSISSAAQGVPLSTVSSKQQFLEDSQGITTSKISLFDITPVHRRTLKRGLKACTLRSLDLCLTKPNWWKLKSNEGIVVMDVGATVARDMGQLLH